MKRQTLLELVDYVNTGTGKFTELVSEVGTACDKPWSLLASATVGILPVTTKIAPARHMPCC